MVDNQDKNTPSDLHIHIDKIIDNKIEIDLTNIGDHSKNNLFIASHEIVRRIKEGFFENYFFENHNEKCNFL